MLRMKDVSKVYRTDTVETHALRGFSLEVEDGEFVSVTGPSGSVTETNSPSSTSSEKPRRAWVSTVSVR